MFAGHGGTPLGNQSALDAAVMTATMPEFLREEDLAPPGRLHRVSSVSVSSSGSYSKAVGTGGTATRT
ncbi:hypothetical protein ACFRQM_17470 [Streptomyces sp. NPDC056831]|uniref:hypothetical protein n=1 Tax=Streptomyces sp. NPDC056831 TaxID=3345954 RepID=UPI003697B5BC